MGRFLAVFVPKSAIATGLLWLLLTQIVPIQAGQGVGGEIFGALLNSAPFILGPLLSASLTITLLRLSAKDDNL